MLELIATDLAKSRSSLGAVTALIDSLLVRTSSPRRAEILGQRAALSAVLEQLVGAEGAGGDDHAAGGQGRAALPQPRPGAFAGDGVPRGTVLGATDWADVGDLALGKDLDAELLREPEVVLGQGVLRVVPAADHAAAAADAARPRGALAAEERIGDLLARLAEEGADPGVLVGVADADLLAVLLAGEGPRGPPAGSRPRPACARRCRSGGRGSSPSPPDRPTGRPGRRPGGPGRACSRIRGSLRRPRSPRR